jgi:tetratricopeptide (TPR) repeat protein
MKQAAILLVAMFLAPDLARGGPCTGAEAQLQSVSRALDSETLDKAEQNISLLEQAYPGCTEIILERSRLLALQGNAAAADAFTRYLTLEPEDSKGYAYFGRYLLEQQQYLHADANSLAALGKNPRDGTALALRGQILLMKGQVQEGVALLEQAIHVDPDNTEANYQLGALADKAKRRAEAVKRFEKVLSINPNDARAWDYVALNAEMLGEVDRVQEAYKKGESVNRPGRHFDAFLDYNFGRFLMKRNDLPEAKAHLDRAVQNTPNVRAVWYERAKVSLLMKNYRDARDSAERAANLRDSAGVILDLQIYALLAQIYSRLGDVKLANKYEELSRITKVPVKESR